MAPRQPNREIQERITITCDHAQLTGDLTVNLYDVPSGRQLKVERVRYINPTGLAEDASNYFAISVKNGSTVVAGPLSTDSAGAGTNSIAADTFTAITVATDGSEVLDAGDVLSVLFDETGTATLPAGRVVIDALLV